MSFAAHTIWEVFTIKMTILWFVKYDFFLRLYRQWQELCVWVIVVIHFIIYSFWDVSEVGTARWFVGSNQNNNRLRVFDDDDNYDLCEWQGTYFVPFVLFFNKEIFTVCIDANWKVTLRKLMRETGGLP